MWLCHLIQSIYMFLGKCFILQSLGFGLEPDLYIQNLWENLNHLHFLFKRRLRAKTVFHHHFFFSSFFFGWWISAELITLHVIRLLILNSKDYKKRFCIEWLLFGFRSRNPGIIFLLHFVSLPRKWCKSSFCHWELNIACGCFIITRSVHARVYGSCHSVPLASKAFWAVHQFSLRCVIKAILPMLDACDWELS